MIVSLHRLHLDQDVSVAAFAETATDIPSASLTVPSPKEGDVLAFSIIGMIDSRTTPGGYVFVRAVCGAGDTVLPAVAAPWAQPPAPAEIPFGLNANYTCTAADELAGTVTVKLQAWAAQFAEGDGFVRATAILARLLRPYVA